ncbi:MAG: hypothetical protein IIZ51_07450, partial [Lachnospiraceae bacterium]|nr:hypothetical protein [Lachnospiraceae bacterium]
SPAAFAMIFSDNVLPICTPLKKADENRSHEPVTPVYFNFSDRLRQARFSGAGRSLPADAAVPHNGSRHDVGHASASHEKGRLQRTPRSASTTFPFLNL